MSKKWQIKSEISQEIKDKFPEINNLVLQLLYNRDLVKQQEIDDFLNPNYDDHVLDPYLFSDMEKAVHRIFQAVQNHEKVMIYGDYDADGVCATTILYKTFKALGINVDIRIPFRDTEGYGLNKKSTEEIIDQGFNLLITVDCGISSFEEVEIFNKKGVNVIITDHHEQPLKLPNALAIINPQVKDGGYPFKKLSGAGVAFKLVQAIIKKQDELNSPLKLPFGFDKWLLDLVAIATIGDIMPILGENRSLVKYGMMVLGKSKIIGIRKLIELINSNRDINTQYVGWRIVPRINAAGRINDASIGFNLLTAETNEEAEKYANILESKNKERQQITEKLMKEAQEQIKEDLERKILWVVGEEWQEGIVGLVAGRLADKYHRPVLTISKKGDKYVGSGRSISGFDITDGLQKCDQLLARYGGHAQACGFTVIGNKNFDDFKIKLTQLAEDVLRDQELIPTLEIEAEIKLEDINWELVDEISKFEPFGEGNYQPIFVSYELKIEEIKTVGSDNNHLKMMVSQDTNPEIHKLIGFSFGSWCDKLNIGDKVDIVYEVGVNEWNGNRELQLKIVDLKQS